MLDKTSAREPFLLERKHVITCRKYLPPTLIGGVSQIRNGNERTENLVLDNFIGHLGAAATDCYLTGNINRFVAAREKANLNPYQGDGGVDLIGTNIDVKTSAMRAGWDHVYNLWIRNKEFHSEHCYVFVLIQIEVAEAVYANDKDCLVYICGFVDGQFIPDLGDGRHGVPESELNHPEILLGDPAYEGEILIGDIPIFGPDRMN